jgi:hypothetical protein
VSLAAFSFQPFDLQGQRLIADAKSLPCQGEAWERPPRTAACSPFTGEEIKALPFPGRWVRGTVLPDEPVNAIGGQLRIGTQNFTYDRLGVQRLT